MLTEPELAGGDESSGEDSSDDDDERNDVAQSRQSTSDEVSFDDVSLYLCGCVFKMYSLLISFNIGMGACVLSLFILVGYRYLNSKLI